MKMFYEDLEYCVHVLDKDNFPIYDIYVKDIDSAKREEEEFRKEYNNICIEKKRLII